MVTDSQSINMEKVKANAERVFSFLGGALVSGTIYLGNRLGLYRTLQDAGSVTSEELAHKTGLHERWIREWLQGQAVAGLIDYKGDGRFALSPEMAMVLSDENSPMFFAGGFRGLPQQMAVLERLPESFKTGIGLPYDAFGPEGALGIAGFSTPWFHTALVQVALPKLDGVVAKLAAGAKVADIGCGAGVALIEIAKAHPKTAFHGYDISKYALERAEANKTQAGARNIIFHDANGDALPADGSFDFVTTFDCIHDATNPAAIIRAVRQALKSDGTWLIADVHGKPTFEENLKDNPMAPLMYGFSVLCCMSSALSEPGGAGLGTLGFHEGVARAMTAEAGFSRFKSHDFDNPINAYYEVRP